MELIAVQKLRNLDPLRPIYITATSDVTAQELHAVENGVKTLLSTIGASDKIPVKNFGNWNYGKGDFESANWYVNETLLNNQAGHGRQVDASRLLSLMHDEPWQKSAPHYEVFVTGRDLFQLGLTFLTGLTRPEFGTVISTKRFKKLDPQLIYECTKTETMHELGHVFDAAHHRAGTGSENKKGAVKHILYDTHCANNSCVMQPVEIVPHGWIQASIDRLKTGEPFCNPCVTDMQKALGI
jgi:predicted Zn-dependent protease